MLSERFHCQTLPTVKRPDHSSRLDGTSPFADLKALIDAGRGDVPLIDLRYRCTKCGSARTDWVVASKRAVAVQPWLERFRESAGRRIACR
jgi:hypothetical protein